MLELCSAAVWATTLLGCNPADEVSSLQSNSSTPQTTFSYQRHSHLQCLRITVHPAAATRQPSVPRIFAAASPVRRTPLDEPSYSVVSISLLWCSARWHSNSLAQPVTRDARSQNRSAGQIGDCAIRANMFPGLMYHNHSPIQQDPHPVLPERQETRSLA